MMGPTHRIWGAWQGMAVGAVVGSVWGPNGAAGTSVLWAGLGWLCATLPDRAEAPLGAKHRGPTHWPEPPLAVAGFAFAGASSGMFSMLIALVVGGVCNSLLSHWTGDFAFGKAHVMKDDDGHIKAILRPRGAPYWFGTRYKGLGWKVNGKGEHRLRKVLIALFPIWAVAVLILSYVYGGWNV